MSKAVTSKPVTTLSIRQQKGTTPLVMLTAYDALTASLLDESVDMLLVGDSLGMVRYGMASTLSVTLEMMILHGRAVAQASKHACVIVDMPFGSYQESPQQAFRNAARMMAETDAQAVKLEGGEEMAETIHYLTQRGIPVMAHIGLTPQYVQKFGGFRVQGRDDASRTNILADAMAVNDAGAFSVVIEGVPEKLAQEITQAIEIPTIGIGASAGCDGQVLVLEDMLGLTPRAPKFVKHYANLGEAVKQAAQSYAEEVRARSFPSKEHCYE